MKEICKSIISYHALRFSFQDDTRLCFGNTVFIGSRFSKIANVGFNSAIEVMD